MLHLNTKRKIMSVAVAGACGWMILPAYAQEVAPKKTDSGTTTDAATPEKPKASTPEVQKASVTGFRAAAEDALNIKKNSDGFVDAISTDGLGRFPELNVGEALTRIPGIQLDRTQGDREARVSLRGLPGGYTVTTVNGLNFADPGASVNGSPMGTFLSDVFNTIVVNKSPGASDASGGLAGNIDLKFRGALESKDGGSIKIASEYNTLGKSKSPSATLKYAKHLTPGFAVFANLAMKKEFFRRDTITQDAPVPIFRPIGVVDPNRPGLNPDQSAAYYRASSVLDTRPEGFYVTNIGELQDYYAAPTTPTAEVPQPAPLSFPVYALNIPNSATKTTSTNGSNTSILDNAAPILGTGAKSIYGVYMPGKVTQISRETKGETRALSAGFGYKINKKLTIDVTALVADKNLNEASSNSVITEAVSGSRITVNPDTLYTTPLGRTFVNDYSYENTKMTSRDQGFDRRRNKTQAVTASATWNNGEWSVVSTVNVSKAQSVTDQQTVQTDINQQGTYRGFNSDGSAQKDLFGQSYPAVPTNGVTGTVSNGLGDISKFKFTLSPANPYYVPTTSLTITPIGLVSNPSSIRQNLGADGRAAPGDIAIGISSLYQVATNKVGAFQQVFERQLTDFPIFESFKFAYQLENNKFNNYSRSAGAVGAPLDGVSTPGLFSGTQKNVDTFFGGVAPGYNRNWQTANYDYLLSKMQPTAQSVVVGNHPVIPGASYQTSTTSFSPVGIFTDLRTDSRGFIVNPYTASTLKNNYETDYKIFGSYLEGQINTKVFGYKVKGRIGLRHENTDKEINYQVPAQVESLASNGAKVSTFVFKKESLHNNYTYNLPSLLLRTEIRKGLQLRYGAYQTYTRPSRAITPVITQTVRDEKDFTVFTIDNPGGNNLVPYTGVSQDIGLEWYNRRGSVIALTYYQKQVKGEVYTVNLKNSPNEACPADGLFNGADYGLGPLVYDPTGNGRCLSVNPDFFNSQSAGPVPFNVRVTDFSKNNTNPYKVRGVELNVQQNSSFLPAPWDKFGSSFTMSSNLVSGVFPDGRKVLLTGTAKVNYSVNTFYDNGPFSIRLIYNKRGEAVVSTDAQNGNVFVKPRGQLDLSTSWKFKGGAMVSLDVFNLGNVLVQQYQQDTRYIRSVAYDGRTASLSTRIPF